MAEQPAKSSNVPTSQQRDRLDALRAVVALFNEADCGPPPASELTDPAAEGTAGPVNPCADGHLEPVELDHNPAYGATEYMCTACGEDWLVAD